MFATTICWYKILITHNIRMPCLKVIKDQSMTDRRAEVYLHFYMNYPMNLDSSLLKFSKFFAVKDKSMGTGTLKR